MTPHIEVRVEGVPVSLGDLDPQLVRKAATYRLLKHLGVSPEEVIYLPNPLSDAILLEDAKPRPQLAEPTVKELTAPKKRQRRPAPRSLASIPVTSTLDLGQSIIGWYCTVERWTPTSPQA